MNKSYLLQGFKETRKTYSKKKSNIFIYLFLTIVSFIGKLFILPMYVFKMFDINIGKNVALHNEINLAEGFRDADNINSNIKLFLITILKMLLILGLIISLGVVCIVLYAISSGLTQLSNISNLDIYITIPVALIGLVLSVVILSIFVPATYVALHSDDKSVLNIIHCCKSSLRASTILKVVLYNLIFVSSILVIPAVVITLIFEFEYNILIAVVLIILLIAEIYVFGYVKLAKDTGIYLLFRNNISLNPKEEKKDTTDLTEEEKLTEIFTKQ